MYIIQVKQNPNLDNYSDMAEEEEPVAAKQRMKQLVGEYQSEGRIVEVKAEAKMEYNDYFDNEKETEPESIEINAVDPESFLEKLKSKKEKELEEEADDIIWPNSPCKRELCAHYDSGECELFADINDPIVNSDGECQGFKSKGKKEYILSEINRIAIKLDKTPTISEMNDNTDIDQNLYYYYFDGYKDACKEAGIKANSGGRK